MDRCPKCGAMRDHCTERHASHGGTFYVCGTFETSGGETSLEGETCLRRQLAQKDRELEQSNRLKTVAVQDYNRVCRELEQSRQREVDLKEALGTANFTIEQRKAGEAELRERLVAANRREDAKDAALGRAEEMLDFDEDEVSVDEIRTLVSMVRAVLRRDETRG